MDKKQILTVVSENLRYLLNQTGLSSSALARKCGISAGTISKIIKGTMSITIPMAINIAKGLEVGLDELLDGLGNTSNRDSNVIKPMPEQKECFAIGILSINNKRTACVKDYTGKILGTSELEGGLDLAESSSGLLQLIYESIYEALPSTSDEEYHKLKYSRLNLVTQSYEFEDTRIKFTHFAKKHFNDVTLLSDWQLTYFATFPKQERGISLIIDKGVSLSYMHHNQLKKLGGWKFPVYDLGGENWLGLETIRHTIEAAEGYVPVSGLAHNILSKFNGKLEKITEACFKRADHDIFCTFSESLLRSFFTGDKTAKEILERGFQSINRVVEKVDALVGKELNIGLHGSLTDVYKFFFKQQRLVSVPSEAEKAKLLTDITKEYLEQHGVRTD